MLKPVKDFLNVVVGKDNLDEMPASTIIIGLLTFPFRFLAQSIGFLLTSWASSRSGFAFIRGLPAIFAAAVLIFGLVIAGWYLETRNVNRYEGLYAFQYSRAENAEREAQTARIAGDVELAEERDGDKLQHAEMAGHYAEKLLGFYPDNPQYYYFMGLARYKNGDKNHAYEVMRHIGEKGLLVENSEGDSEAVPYPPAAVWLAQTTLKDSEREPSKEKRLEEAEAYFLRAIDLLDVKNNDEHLVPYIQSNLGLAQIYSDSEKIPSAISCIKEATNQKLVLGQQIEVIPAMIRLMRKNGQEAEARSYLNSKLKNIMSLARNYPDQAGLWNVVVQSCEAVDDFETAKRTIKEAQLLATDVNTRNNIAKLMGQIHFAQAKAIEDISQFESFAKRLSSAAAAVQLNPKDVRAYSLLNEFIWEEENENYDRWLVRSFVSGGKYFESPNPAIPHLIIGLRYLNSGRISEGTTHWLIANEQLKSRSQSVLNNLFELEFLKLSIALSDPENEIPNVDERIDKLIDAVSVASETFPSQPVFYITRGTIRLFKDQNQLAITDFHQALKRNPNILRVHNSLVDAYKKIGDTEKAEFHENESKRIAKKMAEVRASLDQKGK